MGAASVGFPIDNYWPLLTHQFLHGGWFHIIANMWTLWIFGDNVEDRIGPGRFAIFYLLCGTIAGSTHLLTNPDSTVPSVGASGAIAGVLGAYLLFFPTARLVVLFPIFFLPLFFEVPAVFYLLIWFFSQLLSGTAAVAGPQQSGASRGGRTSADLSAGCFSADYLRDEVVQRNQMNTRSNGRGSRVRVEKIGE